MSAPSRNPRIIKVFVSSPGDVQAERDALDHVVAANNRTDGEHGNFRLELFKWERDTFPQIGPLPQGVVDAHTPPYDVYLGIMSTRFGTPAEKAGSGTEEEFDVALEKWKAAGSPWIMFYFDAAPKEIDDEQRAEQHLKVVRFRAKLDKLGLVAKYKGVEGGNDAFRTQVDEHLRKVARRLMPAQSEAKGRRNPSRGKANSIGAFYGAGVAVYLRRLAEETAHLTLLGLGRSFQIELPIAEAYVPLQTTMARSMEVRPTDRHSDGIADVERNVDLGNVFQETGALKQRGIILLGEPGSGKTTGARQLAWRLASGQNRPEHLGLPSGMVPVLLRFRNLSRAALEERDGLKGLRRFLDEETHCAGAPDGEQSPCDDLWNGKAGGLLWILDGLDEVVDPAARQTVAGWLRDAVTKRPHDWFLVTCRFQGYFRDGVPLGAKFVEYHVRQLNDEQIARFVRDWFGAAHGKLHGPGSQAEQKAKVDSNELLGILARPAYQLGHIRELCTNPLLLTILCIVFHEERKLPTGRADVYAHCVRVLLEHWRRDLYTTKLGTTVQPYDADAAQAVLARLAWWLHQEEQRTTAPLADLATESAKGLAEVSPISGLGRDGAAFVDRMRMETGILAMGGEGAGQCGFLHLSFQEYLAAEYAAREGLSQELASRATESWWREVALLSLRRSRTYCEAFFQEMLRAGIAERYPDLAERCLQEALYFAAGPFVAVLRQSNSPPARVAAVLRLLRERSEQVPDLANVCTKLVRSSHAETRSFAREILVRLGFTVPASAGPMPFDVIVDERTGLTLVALPPGDFLMGSERGSSDEIPVRRVRLTRGAQLGKYPVTNAQYGRYLQTLGKQARTPEFWNDRRFNQPEQPVVGVSWDEAVAYCTWAGGRLPTEAEWEYACRAGAKAEYCFGDDENELGQYAWYDQNSGSQTQPVGAKKPNAWGLHDMHGNVWEWCWDWFGVYDAEKVVDPTGPTQGSMRVFRGGCWFDSARLCRSVTRFRNSPDTRGDLLGFRVARFPVAGS